MCLVDSCTVCYVSVLHYLSGFDSSGAKMSSSTSSTSNREGAAVENDGFLQQVWGGCMRQAQVFMHLFPAVPGV